MREIGIVLNRKSAVISFMMGITERGCEYSPLEREPVGTSSLVLIESNVII